MSVSTGSLLEVSTGPEEIHMRMKIGILDIDDVKQQFKPDFAAFFYYKPVEPFDTRTCTTRFDNLDSVDWKPHFDFMKEVEEVMCTDESYWVDKESGLIFGVINFIPHIQERFNHTKFPFDRQILDIQCHINNTTVKPWALKRGQFPPELSMFNEDWGTAVELNAQADIWDLDNIVVDVINDKKSLSSILNIQVWVQRNSSYFMWNIVFVYSLIIAAQGSLYVFPYAQERFEFAITLALTTVAFQFVTKEMVPKTNYLTILDKYTLTGLGFIATRFVVDIVLQLDPNVFAEDGRSCLAVEGLSVCEIDLIITLCLFLLWASATFSIWVFEWCPSLVATPWRKVNKGTDNTQRVMKGLAEWDEEKRRIIAEDIFDTDKLDAERAEALMALEESSGEEDSDGEEEDGENI